MSAISITVFPDAEAWLKENLQYIFTDNVAAVYPTTKFHPDGLTTYEDKEEGTTKECSMADHVEALKLLCEKIGNTLHVGGLTSPFQLLDAGNWDIEVADAYFQLVFRKEVIYG